MMAACDVQLGMIAWTNHGFVGVVGAVKKHQGKPILDIRVDGHFGCHWFWDLQATDKIEACTVREFLAKNYTYPR